MLPHAINALKKNIIDPFFGSTGNSQNSNEKLPLRSELFTEEQLGTSRYWRWQRSTACFLPIHPSTC